MRMLVREGFQYTTCRVFSFFYKTNRNNYKPLRLFYPTTTPHYGQLLRMWFFLPHNQNRLDYNDSKHTHEIRSKTFFQQKGLFNITKYYIWRSYLRSFRRENVFTLRPGYQLYWAFLRLQVNASNGLFYRSHIRVSKWVEVFSNHVFNTKLMPLESFFFGKQQRPKSNIFSTNRIFVKPLSKDNVLGVYNRGFNWNWRV